MLAEGELCWLHSALRQACKPAAGTVLPPDGAVLSAGPQPTFCCWQVLPLGATSVQPLSEEEEEEEVDAEDASRPPFLLSTSPLVTTLSAEWSPRRGVTAPAQEARCAR